MRAQAWTAKRAAGVVLLGLAVFLAVATARVVLDGRRHFEAAEEKARRGEVEAAMSSYEDAARAYFPASPYPALALDRMSILAKAMQMRGDEAAALEAWEKIRRCVLATRHVFTPNEERLARAERAIIGIHAARRVDPEVARSTVSRPVDPSPIASLLIFSGLAIWIIGAAVVVMSPASAERGRGRMRAAGWIACVAGTALWISMSWLVG